MTDTTPDELRAFASQVFSLKSADGQNRVIVGLIAHACLDDAVGFADEFREVLLSAARQIDKLNEQLLGFHRKLDEHPAMAHWRASR